MRGVASFSLFGKDEEDVYYKGALKNAEMYAEIRPDWMCYFYVSVSVPGSLVQDLIDVGNSKVIRMLDSDDRRSTYWRFLTIREEGWDCYVSRDVDSRPYARENAAVDDWLDSGKPFHSMRDHPRHGVPMLAGMWGCTAYGARIIRPRLPDRLKTDYYQVDQDFLKYHVWPYAKRLVYVSSDCKYEFEPANQRHPFRVPREDFDFVAECHNGDETLRFPDHRMEIAISGYRAQP